MQELAFVILVIVGIFASQWFMVASFSTTTLIQVGLILLAIGITEGIPTGLYYHVLLYKTLHPRGQLPIRWWISPQQYHVHLNQEENRRIRRWFFLGGLGFFLCMIGGAVAFIGMWSGTF
jgi:hypothetical protein